MKTIIKFIALTALCAGCSSKPAQKASESEASMKPEVKAIVENPNLKMVHFAFNKYNLTDEAKAILDQDIAALKGDGSLKFWIEGFCDERGTVQYNMTLGEKRAEAVRSYLEKQGISSDQASVISFGKSDPLDAHKNENAYALNRRASFYFGVIPNRASL